MFRKFNIYIILLFLMGACSPYDIETTNTEDGNEATEQQPLDTDVVTPDPAVDDMVDDIVDDVDPGTQVYMKRTIKVGNIDRTYNVYLPGNYDTRSTPAQVVIAFHPASSSSDGMELITKLHIQDGAEDAVIVYPDGLQSITGNQAWNAGFCCTSADDVAFFDAMVSDLSHLTSIKQKISITGYSSGAMMVYRLLCDRSEMIEAAVPFGAYMRSQDITNTQACVWEEQVPVMHIHGMEDKQMNPNGQASAYYPNSNIQTPSLSDYMNLVANRNGGIQNAPSFFSIELDSQIYQINDNTHYTLIDGLGHAWPGVNIQGQYGPGRIDLEGSKFVMNFLLQ